MKPKNVKKEGRDLGKRIIAEVRDENVIYRKAYIYPPPKGGCNMLKKALPKKHKGGVI
ncbi:MAG: hypothetical protein KAU16_07080 [Methanophagales archaeon]|nr:hypothetical protein [Methanophagales archaeon]